MNKNKPGYCAQNAAAFHALDTGRTCHGDGARWRRRVLATMEQLESRTFLTAVPSDADQYVLELINRARAAPTAEVTRLSSQTWGDPVSQGTAYPAPQTPDLNEGLPAGTISSSAEQPLAFNSILLGTSAEHTQYMITYSDFNHNETMGGQNNTPFTRMTSAGYPFSTAGENIAASTVSSNTDTSVINAAAEQLHDDLFIDGGEAGRGHRVNLMDPDFKEVGIGVGTGDTTIFGATYHSELMTEDFGTSSTNTDSILTGVVFNDTAGTKFYAPGEGLGGATVTATPVGGGQALTTTTWNTGGYSLPLPAGTYNITVSQGGAGTVAPITVLGASASATVTIGTSNVEVDFTNTPTPTSTTPVVTGVSVGSTSWNASFPYASGYPIPTGAAQLTDVPWVNLNQVNITFNQAVNVTQASLAVTGQVSMSYPISSFSYNSATFTATWTFASPLVDNKMYLDLSATGIHAVTAATGGVALDGTWTNGTSTFPSGASAPGTDFNYDLNVLPGDPAQTGGPVNILEVIKTRNLQLTAPGNGTYSPFYDVDGSAGINILDVIDVRNRQLTSLPTTNNAFSQTAPPTPMVSAAMVSASQPSDANYPFFHDMDGSGASNILELIDLRDRRLGSLPTGA